MDEQLKILLGVAFDTAQAKIQVNALTERLKKDAKLKLGIDLSDKDANKIVDKYLKDTQRKQESMISYVTNKKLSDIRKVEQAEKQSIESRKRSNISAIDLEIKKREEASKRFSSQLKEQIVQSQKDSESALSMTSKKDKAFSSIDSYMNSNTKLTRASRNEFEGLRRQIALTGDGKELSRLTSKISILKDKTKSLGQVGKSSFDEMKNNLGKMATWLVAGTVIFGSQQAIQSMVDNVFELDKAMIELKKVTDETSKSYNSFTDNAFDTAKRLGTGVATFVNQTAEWAKAGYNLKEAAKLAESSTVFQNVANIDSSESVGVMISAMKAFNIESEKSIDIVDKLNEVNANCLLV